MSKRYFGLPAAAAAIALLVAGVAGVSAASGAGPMGEVLGVFGLGATPGDTHGTAVSGAVGDAIESSTPGEDRGDAVMLAACPTAHERANLPPGAQTAPGQEDKEPKVCETAKGEKESSEDEADASLKPSKDSSHGQAVREAVHASQTSSQPGAGRGAAVSVAACIAAHDRTTLPEGAQDAAGRQDKETKDCTNPAEAGTADLEEPRESEDSADGKGRGGGKGEGKPDTP